MKERAMILPASHIDATRWDSCVANNTNGLIYAGSIYLNTMTDHWHGVVIDDYAAVMPIPWRMKWGFRYAYIPAFTQQMGLIGCYDPKDLTAVVRTLPDFVSLADLHFNFSNEITGDAGSVRKRNNLVIDLNRPAVGIRQGYTKSLQDRLRSAEEAGLRYGTGNDIETPVILFRSLYGRKISHITGRDTARLVMLCQMLREKEQCFVKNVYAASGELLAAALFLRDNKRIYNLVNAVLPEGRKQFANHFLLHNVLMEFAGTDLLFDFEGSDIPGVQQFFGSFGAVSQPYSYYHYNGLPWWLRLFKK